MWAPKVDQTEALKVEPNTSSTVSTNNETPFNDGCAGLRVVRLLEAASAFAEGAGRAIRV